MGTRESTSDEAIDIQLDVSRRWLPPSPHREQILEAVKSGRAHIQHRGHGIPPLLVFDGEGGAIELPKVRYEQTYRGMRLVATGDSSQPDQTRHPDVCGSVDELKGILTDNPDMAKEEPDTLFQLLDDSKHMIRRMHRRRTEYEAFVQAVSSLCEQAEDPDVEQAYEAADRIRAALSERPAQVTRELADLHSLAETVRRIAQQQEKCLKHYKDLSVGITELCEEIRGERDWRSQE